MALDKETLPVPPPTIVTAPVMPLTLMTFATAVKSDIWLAACVCIDCVHLIQLPNEVFIHMSPSSQVISPAAYVPPTL